MIVDGIQDIDVVISVVNKEELWSPVVDDENDDKDVPDLVVVVVVFVDVVGIIGVVVVEIVVGPEKRKFPQSFDRKQEGELPQGRSIISLLLIEIKNSFSIDEEFNRLNLE